MLLPYCVIATALYQWKEGPLLLLENSCWCFNWMLQLLASYPGHVAWVWGYSATNTMKLLHWTIQRKCHQKHSDFKLVTTEPFLHLCRKQLSSSENTYLALYQCSGNHEWMLQLPSCSQEHETLCQLWECEGGCMRVCEDVRMWGCECEGVRVWVWEWV